MCRNTFIHSDNAHPYIGKKQKLEYVNEEKIEAVCDIEKAKKIIRKIREVHPYEEVEIDIIPLINEEQL